MRERCAFCGEPYELGVLEHFPAERTFLLSACCEGAHEDAVAWAEEVWSPEGLEEERRSFRAWFARETGTEIRGVVEGEDGAFRYGNGGLSLDYGLQLGAVSLQEAKAFTAKNHRHAGEDGQHRPPVSWRWGHAVFNGGELVGVAMVGRPVARLLDATTTVEVRRVCIDPGIPRELARDACSMLYGAACREAKARGFQKVVTYTLEEEAGVSLKAAGFTIEARTRGGSWDRPSRRRGNVGPTSRKVRWSRTVSAPRRRAA